MTVPSFLHGAIAPVFTAFDDNDLLDDTAQRHIIDHLEATASVSACFIRSGLGQMFTFSFDDVRQITRNVCTHAGERMPILAGCAGIWDHDLDHRPDSREYVRQAIELSRYAEECGASATVHTVPDALLPGPHEEERDVTLRYFCEIADNTDLPILIYQSPATTESYRLDPTTLADLASMDPIVGAKISTNDARYILDMSCAVGDAAFSYICGAETAFLAGLVSGARACIGQGTTVNPQIVLEVQRRFEEGDLPGAVEAQRTVNDLVAAIPKVTEFYKRYLTEQGLPVNPRPRGSGGSAYSAGEAEMTDEEYTAARDLLHASLERHGFPVPVS